MTHRQHQHDTMPTTVQRIYHLLLAWLDDGPERALYRAAYESFLFDVEACPRCIAPLVTMLTGMASDLLVQLHGHQHAVEAMRMFAAASQADGLE